ncbi:MAG: VWA domain-containing protein [Myxococcales bacterium]|jgi:Ca-activated chloride channel family protein|nr:VWA domain-containing protein [Myxococcales bacterium]
MKLRTTVLLAMLGVLGSSAGALAIPLSKGPDAAIKSDVVETPKEKRELARFVAGKTLTMDVRLGHATLAEAGRGETYLFAQVAGAEGAAVTQAPPMNLAIVIDRSGSMKGDRIANAIAAAVGSVERMRDGDTVTVVTFDTQAQVVVAPTRVSQSNRASIEGQIRSIRLGGDTCISCGLDEAMRQLESAPVASNAVQRMLLLSDGATNHGIRDVGGLRTMAGRMRGKGFAISTVGVDVDFDEKVMAAIASESNGKHYFVASPSALPQVFSQEFDSLLASVAKDAEMIIELAPGVEVAEVFDRSFRREGNKLIVPFGTFSGAQEKTVLVKLKVPTDKAGERSVADVKLAYQDLAEGRGGSCDGTLAAVVTDERTAQKDLDPFVAARLERSRTAQTLTQANILFEQGKVDEARKTLAIQRQALKAKETEANVLAQSGPFAKPANGRRSLDRDFEDQLGAVARAEKSFEAPAAPAGDTGGAGFARPAPPSPAQLRDGKAGVRSNQQAATDLAF